MLRQHQHLLSIPTTGRGLVEITTSVVQALQASRIDETRFEGSDQSKPAAILSGDPFCTASKDVDSSVQTRATSSILLSARNGLAEAVRFDMLERGALSPSPSPDNATRSSRPNTQDLVKPVALDALAPSQLCSQGMHTPRPSPAGRLQHLSPVGASTPLLFGGGTAGIFAAFESPARV